MDAGTIFTTVALMVLANGAVLASIQADLPDELRPAARRWQIATVLVAVGCGIFAFGDGLPIPFMVTVANGLLVAGLTFYLWAVQRFHGERPSALEAGFCVLVVAGVFWFSAFVPNFTLRVCIISVFWASILGRTAWILHRHGRASPSRSRRMLLAIYVALIACVVARAGLYVHEGMPAVFTAASSDAAINLVSPIVMALLPVVGTTAFALMCVDRVRRQLQTAASTDHLTALANRRVLAGRGEALLARATRGGGGFAAVVFDLDHFKAINDSHGHAVGDRALVHAAATLRAAARENDLAARSGGEEFVLLIDGADEDAAFAVAERVRATLAATPFAAGDIRVPLTVSAGVTAWRPGDAAFDTMLRRADRALYRAKAGGRDRVERAV